MTVTMNTPIPSDELALMKFGIGQPVPRVEDPKLLRGEGRYTDDLDLPGQVYAVIVRSPHAHGIIRAVDTAAARDMPGVLGVYTAADLERGGYGPLKVIPAFKNRDGSPMLKPARFALAADRVRFVGDPVAFVVAETASEARDAAEAVSLDIEALPAVTRPEEALAPGAPQLYEDVPGNCPLDFHFGDAERVTQAFAAAAHVTRLKLTDNRVVVNPMEPRSAVGAYAADEGRWTLHVGSQGVFGLSQNMAEILGVPRDEMRVLTGNVGGSFGMKAAPYPEYVCLLHAARALRRPVKWTDLRSESFLSDHHGRALELDSELALDAAGRFLAVRVSGYADLGAFMTQMSPLPSTLNVAKNLVSVYRTPAIDVSIRCAFTNTVPIGPYRGAGRPEGNYFMERLVATAAAEMGLDEGEMRRRNHIGADQMPY